METMEDKNGQTMGSEEELQYDPITAVPVQRQASVNNIEAIPNGGLRAWLQVIGTFILFFNTWFVQVQMLTDSMYSS
jgi:hypothetical protein